MPDEVTIFRIGVLEANFKEISGEIRRLDVLIAELRGKAETDSIQNQIKELRSEVIKLNSEMGQIVGALAQSSDKRLSTAAQEINITVASPESTNFHGDAEVDQIGDR